MAALAGTLSFYSQSDFHCCHLNGRVVGGINVLIRGFQGRRLQHFKLTLRFYFSVLSLSR